eukprot:TRINITY_DN835_c1_g1_i2.p1 TRINITY_DN835_c1_g1~~TRINITY_DN835_c1_g1_i2.p1  ORF type:complete len:489 (-),score=105.23 TRINITY_DN835_c1_g1_i2:64-1530(-)
MAAESLQDQLHGFLSQDGTRWLLVVLGVVILLRLRLVLFAAALPVLAYWHYSNQPEAKKNADSQNAQDQGEEEEDEADFDERDPAEDDALDDLDLDADLKQDSDIYDDSFWEDKAKPRGQGRPGSDPKGPRDDDLGLGKDGFSWDGGRDELDDLLSRDEPSQLPGLNGRPGLESRSGLRDSPGPGLDEDDFGLGGGLDFDFLDGGGGSKGKGKGKGKSKDGKGKDKDPNAPREADPKQVFVANVGEAPEDEIRSFFEQVGEVVRLKVLKDLDGSSKGVCFVTFRTEEEAQKAVTLHGSPFEAGDGRNLVVKPAHGGNKGKGEGKGKSSDRDGPPDLGGSERFGSFGGGGDRERPNRNSGKGRGKGRGTDRGMDDILEEALADQDGPLKVQDFDFTARRFLGELRSRDRNDGGSRFNEAMDMVLRYTSSKDRSSVRKWPAYVYTLLSKFDPSLSEEMREKDAERRAQKGGGRSFVRARQDSDDREDRDD